MVQRIDHCLKHQFKCDYCEGIGCAAGQKQG